MIKNYKFSVNEDEKNRILSLHEDRTKSQYLTLTESKDIELDEQEYEFAFSQVQDPSTPKSPVTQQNVTMKDETGDTSYVAPKTQVQSLTPQEVTKLSIEKQNEQPKNDKVPTTTFPKSDPSGKQTVLNKMKELGLDRKDLKTSIETVIKALES